ncbi:glycosyltransferase family 2 protein [Cellulomonas carbonis]|uniref:glycosyltransferase family 2 protein n=1 Tax=Cellulomonas carbonis TaxID=1386092 RepID=UPI0009DF5BA5|nr:glycosyltransferase family 2 protein [Cellulomonas carbonis]
MSAPDATPFPLRDDAPSGVLPTPRAPADPLGVLAGTGDGSAVGGTGDGSAVGVVEALPAPAGPQVDTTAEAGAVEVPRSRHRYVPVAAKFLVAVVGAALWVTLAVVLSRPWIAELTPVVGPVGAFVVVGLVAYLPGAVVAFLAVSLALDRQPPLRSSDATSAVTVVVAARNEQEGIVATLESVARVEYAGELTIVLADNGSTDATVERALAAAPTLGVPLRVVHEATPGKAHALNAALATVTTPLVVTVDADTLLHREALGRLVARLEAAPADTVAVAGSVLVRNSRRNFLTRMQEWDYYLGITAVKRMQGLYQSTLVAQGAFSVYRTEDVREVGGWPDAIGEDIVVTWRLMEAGRRVFFEPTAVAFTDAPERVRHFFRQRARWARGMLEGIRAVPPWRQERVLTKFVAGIDLLIPLLDVGYALIWLPGLVLFLLGHPLVVSMWTLAVLPVTLLVYGGLRIFQSRHVFAPLDLRVRRNRLGYIGFLLLYQVLCSTASLVGYTQFLGGTRRRWK